MDSRIIELAKGLVNYSCSIKSGEKVLIEYVDVSCIPLVKAIIKEVYRAGGYPYVKGKIETIHRELLMNIYEEQINLMAELDLKLMQAMDAYIGIRGGENLTELSDVPAEKHDMFSKLYYGPVHFEERVNNTKWVILRYPNNSMAQNANMSLEAFEDFYFDVCTLDYAKLNEEQLKLKEFMEKADHIRLTGPGTDLKFRIGNLPVIPCSGNNNIPDGEVFTAPIRDSINGTIKFNCPTIHEGTTFTDIELEFKDGKVINASCNNTDKLNAILDSDDGARYVGEFAIGTNLKVTKPMLDILFDEKITGSIHLALGSCYDDCNNGNKSSIHWDLVLIQTAEAGGGEVWFDDVLIRKDGLFIPSELKGLNP